MNRPPLPAKIIAGESGKFVACGTGSEFAKCRFITRPFMTDLFSPLTLPNGSVIANRICKAAMEENMADAGQLPGKALENLYARWAKGKPGLILTGNVMVDPRALTGPGGVVLQKNTLDDPDAQARFTRWAKTAKTDNPAGQVWMQISHPGRQVYASQGTQAVSASATKVSMPGFDKMFAPARALTTDEIKAQISRFADTAFAAKMSGFDGVEIHAAHGYLVAQFLSPLTNLRDDDWGGALKNRARFLLEIVRAVRAATGPDFGVGVKLNSADFQRGGFDVDDARQVVTWLNAESVDLVELSGGSYESSAMMGHSEDGRVSSTAAREMYFIDFAKDIIAAADMPIMVTGGVTKLTTAIAAMETGVDMVGIARSMAYAPNLPDNWKSGRASEVRLPRLTWKNKTLAALGSMSLTKEQLHTMGAGKPPKPGQNAVMAIIKDRLRIARLTKRYKAWLKTQDI